MVALKEERVTIIGIIFLALICVAVMGLMVFLALVFMRLTAPRGFSRGRGRRKGHRHEDVEGTIARYDEVQTKRSRNVFFWPW